MSLKSWYIDPHTNDKPESGFLLDKLRESAISEAAAAVQNMPVTVDSSVDVLDTLRDLVPADVYIELSARVELGVRKYGSRLKTNNGRDVVIDIRQELLDAIMYVQQAHLQSPVGSQKSESYRDLRKYLVGHLHRLNTVEKE